MTDFVCADCRDFDFAGAGDNGPCDGASDGRCANMLTPACANYREREPIGCELCGQFHLVRECDPILRAYEAGAEQFARPHGYFKDTPLANARAARALGRKRPE